MQKIFILCLTLSLAIPVNAQNEWNWQPGMQADYQLGWVLPVNPFLRGVNSEREKILHFQTISIEIYKQTIGQQLWEQQYNYPQWGAGLAVFDFFNPEELGRPFALFGFFKSPFINDGRFSLKYQLRFGMAFNWQPFNPVSNPYNIVIGSKITAYLNAGMEAIYALSQQIDLGLGFSLTHFSNGSLHKPNYGLNTAAPRISISYRPNYVNTERKTVQEVPVVKKSPEYLLSLYYGIHEVIIDTTTNNIRYKYLGNWFPTFGIFSVVNFPVNYKSKLGFGINLSYDNAVNAKMILIGKDIRVREAPFIQRIQFSIFPSYEWVVHKFSVILQPGIYIFRSSWDSNNSLFYQRLGLRYQFERPWFIGIHIRAIKFHIAQYIEWTIGYRFQSK